MSDTIFQPLFRLHDVLSGFIARHVTAIRRGILALAHLSLLGILFPQVYRDYGNAALMMLLAVLFLSPAARITRMRLAMQLLGFRRELGVMMGYFALVHGLGYVVTPEFYTYYVAPYLSSGMILRMDPRLIFGIIAIFLTLPLLLSSNGVSLRVLGGVNWKRLHFLVYPMFVLVVFHQSFRLARPDWDVSRLFGGLLLVFAYFLLKLITAKREWFPTIYGMMEGIAGRYSNKQIPNS